MWVNEASCSWQIVFSMQFFCVGGSDAPNAIKVAPGAFLLAGVGCRQHRRIATAKCFVPGYAVDHSRFGAPFLPKGDEGLIVSSWPPTVAKNVKDPGVETPQERPSDGTIICALPNENVSLINPKFEQFASRKQVNM